MRGTQYRKQVIALGLSKDRGSVESTTNVLNSDVGKGNAWHYPNLYLNLAVRCGFSHILNSYYLDVFIN